MTQIQFNRTSPKANNGLTREDPAGESCVGCAVQNDAHREVAIDRSTSVHAVHVLLSLSRRRFYYLLSHTRQRTAASIDY